MTGSPRPLAFFSLLVIGSLTSVAWGQVESLKIGDAVAITARLNGESLYVVRKNGQLTKWDGDESGELHSDLSAEPAQLTDVNFLFSREGSVSAFGSRDKAPAFATFRFEELPDELSVKPVPGISGPLAFAAGKQIRCVAGTANSLFVVVAADAKSEGSGSESSLWRLDLRVATMADPVELSTDQANVLAMTVTDQGHLLAAIKEPSAAGGKVALRFHHPQDGKVLIKLSTDLDDVASLVTGPDGLLYTAGSRGDESGLFRIDVVYKNRRQACSLKLIEPRTGARQLSSNSRYLYLIDDEGLGRLKLRSDDAAN